MCCTSVGSLNAMPIMTRKVEYLASFWERPDENPVDKIMVRWRPHEVQKAMCARAVYAGMNTKPIEAFWDQCTLSERALLKNVTILSYDRKMDRAISERCTDKATAIRAIVAACCFPWLYPPNPERPHVIDGFFIDDIVPLLPSSAAPWLCLDLTHAQENQRVASENPNLRMRVFSPKGVATSTASMSSRLACIDSRRSSISSLISQGESDADAFISSERLA
jgi:hypothetical protein